MTTARVTVFAAVALCTLLPSLAHDRDAPHIQPHNRCVVCLWSPLSPYANSTEDIPANLCTHLVYSYAAIDGAGYTLKNGHPRSEGDLDKFAVTKKKYPKLKLLLRIGNCSRDGAAVFASMSSSSEGRAAFAKAAFDWLDKHYLDGVLLSWCYPTSQQRDNLVNVVKELRKELSRINRRTLVSLEVPASEGRLLPGFNMTALARLVDFFYPGTSSKESWLNDFHGPSKNREAGGPSKLNLVAHIPAEQYGGASVDTDDLKDESGRKNPLLKTVRKMLNPVTNRKAESNLTKVIALKSRQAARAPTFNGKKCINDVCMVAGSSAPAITTLLITVSILTCALFGVE